MRRTMRGEQCRRKRQTANEDAGRTSTNAEAEGSNHSRRYEGSKDESKTVQKWQNVKLKRQERKDSFSVNPGNQRREVQNQGEAATQVKRQERKPEIRAEAHGSGVRGKAAGKTRRQRTAVNPVRRNQQRRQRQTRVNGSRESSRRGNAECKRVQKKRVQRTRARGRQETEQNPEGGTRTV
jgi:hypothetical protein